MIKKNFLVGDLKIEVYDDVFSWVERSIFYNYALNSLYSPTREPSNKPNDRKYGKTLFCQLNQNDMLRFGFFRNNFIINYIKNNNFRIFNAKIIICVASDVFGYHADSYEDDSVSCLYYMNEEWKPHWEGETHFSLDAYDIDYSCSFKPGRLVFFDSKIPHKSSQPSFDSEENRYVLVINFVNSSNRNYENSFDILNNTKK